MENLKIIPIEKFKDNIPTKDGEYYGEDGNGNFVLEFTIKDGILNKNYEFSRCEKFLSLPIIKNTFDVLPQEKGFYYTIRYNGEEGWHAFFDGKEWLNQSYHDEFWIFPQVDISDEYTKEIIFFNWFIETIELSKKYLEE